MSSSTPDSADEPPPHADEVPPGWDDVTDAFAGAVASLAVGEMLHSSEFTLSAAMSAIELMEPKMDVGCGPVRDLSEVDLPSSLTDVQTLVLMDRLLACEMSWLDSHTLTQTVFSCVFVQRLEDIPRVDLFTFIRLQLATMHCANSLIVAEKVAEEEDFVIWTFGFRLPRLHTRHPDEDDAHVARMLSDIDAFYDAHSPSSPSTVLRALRLRLRFRTLFFKLLRCLSGHYQCMSPFEAPALVVSLIDLVAQWSVCPFRKTVDNDLIRNVFDPSVNRHLMTSTPPRTAPLFDIQSALRYLTTLLKQIRAVLLLRDFALPPHVSSNNPPRYSLHIAVHALISFCASHNPTVLVRAVMSRLMLMIPDRSTYMFDNEGAEFVRMVATDMGVPPRKQLDHPVLRGLDAMRDGVVSIFECFCRNRSRQRRMLLRVLRWWDHCTYIASRGQSHARVLNGSSNREIVEIDAADQLRSAIRPGKDNSHDDGVNDDADDDADDICPLDGARNENAKNEAAVSSEGGDGLKGKTPLQIVSYEVCCRLMVQHLLLGFECELYHEFEYAAMYFYVGYVLTSLSNATVALGKSGLKDPSLHPLRFALYLMDEARLWLCRALYLSLAALSSGGLWKYSCERRTLQRHADREVFGSEELWYDQRFGVMTGLINGPPYANHASFKAFVRMQEDSLRKDDDAEGDMVVLRLKEAVHGFRVARRKLELAKKTAEACNTTMLLDEILQLGRVAVENSIGASQFLQQYDNARTNSRTEVERWSVSFCFGRHRHFPVLKTTEVK